MKYFIIICFIVASCQSKNDRQVQLSLPIRVLATDTSLHNNNGTWIWKGKKYNGYLIEKKEGILLEELPIVDGKENGIAKGWYKNGKKRFERNFQNGDREGIDKGWYENGKIAFEYFFKNDKYEGSQKTFYESGNPWQLLNYKNGYEDGKQKSWSDSSGRVINNFTVKNGKLYGVIGRYDCMSVIKK